MHNSRYLHLSNNLDDFCPMKLLVTLAGGGHLWEARSLLRHLGNYKDVSFAFVTAESVRHPEAGSIPDGPISNIRDIASIHESGRFRSLVGLFVGTAQCIAVILRERPDAVLGVGTAISVPLLLAGRLSGKKTIFVESITRVDNLSLTGRIIARFHLADRIYTQWPEVDCQGTELVYKGTVI